MPELVTAPLRLMIYDKTENSTKIDVNGPEVEGGEFVVPLGLTASWVAGGALYRALRWVDMCLGVESWDEALDWLAVHSAPKRIAQIQVWGHGGPGVSVLGRERMNSRSILGGDHESRLRMIGQRMTSDGVWWFRNCGVFAGVPGQNFARRFVSVMQARVAAHTHIIGPWQSGLHTLGPGEDPSWPATEGIADGSPERPKKLVWSKPWSTHTVTLFNSKVPRGW